MYLTYLRIKQFHNNLLWNTQQNTPRLIITFLMEIKNVKCKL